MVVTEPLLQAVQIDTRFEQVGGVGMAQRMDASTLGDAGVRAGCAVPALGGLDVHRPRGVARGAEQPRPRMSAVPPGTQQSQHIL